MSSLVETLGGRVVGTVQAVAPNYIAVLLELDAPQATALNSGIPSGFPRINGYVLIPNEVGATVATVASVKIERSQYPKRQGLKDFGLVDLPFPTRVMSVIPLGTLVARSIPPDEALGFEVRRGVDVFPSVGDPALLPTPTQLRAIVEGEGSTTRGRLLLGRSPLAGGAEVFVDPNKLFGRHLAVLGNTGAGKSCTVAGLIRWSLEAARKERDRQGRTGNVNARFIVLDPNGEYSRAFSDLGARLFQVEPEVAGARQLKVPAWLWNGEEWAAFSGAAPGIQRPLLLDALRRLRAGTGHPDPFQAELRARVLRYLGRLRAAKAGGEHQGFGRRDDTATVMLNAATDLTASANDPACADPATRAALLSAAAVATAVESAAQSYVDRHGVQRHNDFTDQAVLSVIAAIEQAQVTSGIEEEPSMGEDAPAFFSVEDLPAFVEALASNSGGRDLAQFVDSLNLRIRSLFARGRLSSVADPDEQPRLADWLDDYVGADQATDGQIAILDLSLIPSDVVHVVVGVLTRLVFEAVQRYRRANRGSELPTVLVLEEAHTFLHKELTGSEGSPAARMCRRAIERVAREGRKFGLGLVLSSQRPSEISATALSQCNTFLLHRLVNDLDQTLVKRLVPEGLGELLRELPSLPSRRAILLGWAAPAPVLLEIQELAEGFRPHSPDPRFWEVWTGDLVGGDRRIDWAAVADDWARPSGEPDDDVEGADTAASGDDLLDEDW